MKQSRTPFSLQYGIVGAILIGIVLKVCLVQFSKNKVLTKFEGVSFYISQPTDCNFSLYYSFSDKFQNNQVLLAESVSNKELRFNFPKSNQLPTSLRLDFGNEPLCALPNLDSLSINYKGNSKMIQKEDLFQHIIGNSASIYLNKNDKALKLNVNSDPFDPYIIFDPLLKIVLDEDAFVNRLILLLPFLLLLGWHLKNVSIKTLQLPDVLCIIFIVCIPLKIAWTTLAALLIGLFGIMNAIRKKEYNFKNKEGLLLIGVFIVFLIIGRPTSLKIIDHHLALILFFIISSTFSFNWAVVTKFYIQFILFLNAALVTSGVAFLINFPTVFGLDIWNYFSEIKFFSGNVREWLYYDHAVFLTFFGLIGLLSLHKHSEILQSKKILLLYHLLLIGLIFLIGARISLLIYLVFIVNMYFDFKPKKRLIINTIVFSSSAVLLFLMIGKIDVYRDGLWKVSWEAIINKPYFGYGLGSSDKVLHSTTLMSQAKVNIPTILNHSHNQYLTFLLELGFIGSCAIISCVMLYLKHKAQYLNITMVLFIFGLCYVFLTESILQTSKPLFVLCFLFYLISKMPSSITFNELDKQA
ncbi:O-antigen ligase family protein [Maribacter sp. MAR_2009_72]|uniref:O-antigen ligase family protein n=1 Tax=Maribacter sp. MAR_2009_72 TaxID=1250050 RepID=UPI001199A9E6|nr:O-antigen ligase family protein [Maribacter sp. MAR_2009_72]TVZ16180.1 O-antigen ligase [Maribacter sp. MAR_2009_72]